jgi:phage baseplate assembly protein W
MATGSRGGNEFLGAGIAFPLGVDAQGHLAMNSLEDHVRQSIGLIFQTAKGERVMQPDFGASLHDLVFEPMTPVTITRVQHEVQDALRRFEPRIDVLNVDVTVDPTQQGVLRIHVEYRVRRTDTIFNLVYPFYLERGAL